MIWHVYKVERCEHVLEGACCWCRPAVDVYQNGVVVLHNDAIGVRLGLHPRYIAEAKN